MWGKEERGRDMIVSGDKMNIKPNFSIIQKILLPIEQSSESKVTCDFDDGGTVT